MSLPPTAANDPGHPPLQVLTLAMAGDIFALASDTVLEVLDIMPMTDVPNCRPFIRGLINVRGKVVPVVDLKIRLGIPAVTEQTQDSRIVVTSIVLKGEDTQVGILADRVYEVMEIPHAQIEDAPTIGIGWHAEFIHAIGKYHDGFIIVLDMEKIFTDDHARPG